MKNSFPKTKQYLIDDLAVWRHKIRGVRLAVLPPNTSRPNPLVFGDLVIASVFSPGMIYAVDKETGRPRWRLQIDGYGSASVTISSGIVYGRTSHTLYAIDAKSGKARWVFCPYGTSHECIYSSPTIAKGFLFFGDRAGLFHCLDAKTGKHLWWEKTSRANNNDVNATAVYHEGAIIVATNSGVVIAFEPSTGRQIWKQHLDDSSIDELRMFEGNVFVQTQRSVYLLYPNNGEVTARFNWRGESIRTSEITDNKIIIISRNNHIFENASDEYDRGNTMRCISENTVLYKRPSSCGISGLKWDKKNRLLYVSRIEGLCLIQPETGNCICNIKSKKGELFPGIVDVQRKHIYLLTNNGTLYSFRHP